MEACVEECSVLCEAGVRLVWFDSLGAKSSCLRVGGVLVDPGAAAMQPGYPLPSGEKARLRLEAVRAIEDASRGVECIVVTHYHYDHHLLPSDQALRLGAGLYLGTRVLLLKNPNTYINESQWKRSRLFLGQLLEAIGAQLDDYLVEPRSHDFRDPVEELGTALSRSFGDYDSRRRELLERGRRWFEKVSRMWATGPWVRERIVLGEGPTLILDDHAEVLCGGARVRLLGPWFHGVEYDRTGWVTPVLIEYRGLRLLYTSDLMGPVIEDYAERIASLKPDVIVADGPPTYLFPYMFNRINLGRAVENMVYLLENTSSLRLVVYDHHLLREKRWRERVAEVFEASRRTGVPVLTAAECLGEKPLIDVVAGSA